MLISYLTEIIVRPEGGGVLPKTWCTRMLKGFEVHFHQFWYTNGVLEIVPGILMTPYFCDGMEMGCFKFLGILMTPHLLSQV